MAESYDVTIVGGGITGAAICYATAVFTDIDSIALLEKASKIGTGVSHHTQNSQTLHFGDVETNYDRETATSVKEGAELLAGYLEGESERSELYAKRPKMVLGVGESEVATLEQRHEAIGGDSLFPRLEMINREEISELEPAIVEGRDPEITLGALYSPDGYAVDYGATARAFVDRAREQGGVTIHTDRHVQDITPRRERYTLETSDGALSASAVVVAAGGYGLGFAKTLGYGADYSLLPVAGGYVRGSDMLTGKVYTIQDPEIPFAAIHGDADVHDQAVTRFGPTALPVPTLEPGRLSTVPRTLSMMDFDTDAMSTYVSLLWDGTLREFLMENLMYHLPAVGLNRVLPRVQKIVPTATVEDLQRELGGVRPQVLNTRTNSLDMGETRIVGQNIIFEIAPSPGASVCLQTARRDARALVDMLDGDYSFDGEGFHAATSGNFPDGATSS